VVTREYVCSVGKLGSFLGFVLLVFGLVACGGDGTGKAGISAKDRTAAASRPSRAEDSAAVEQVLLAYGAAKGAKSCDYLAANEITHLGGLASCRRKNADLSATIFRVENVAVNRDTANAVITAKGRKSYYYELVREGRPGGIGGGWKISSFPGDGLGSGSQTTHAPAPVTPTEGARAQIRELLTAFGKTRGSAYCNFFSKRLIEKRGGLAACRRYFADKPALDSKIISVSVRLPVGKQDVLPSAGAVIKSGVSGKNLYLGFRQGGPIDRYGGWVIDRQGE
jgi:hypothetical protein